MTEESKAKSTKLTIKDRFMIREVLPQHGTLVDQILAVDVDRKVAFNQAEIEEIGLKQEGTTIAWKDDATLEKEVEFSGAELEFIDRQIKRMSGEGLITRDMVDTILKLQSMMRVS